jgi:hypothetical protein
MPNEERPRIVVGVDGGHAPCPVVVMRGKQAG